jgi:hypothetical protein
MPHLGAGRHGFSSSTMKVSPLLRDLAAKAAPSAPAPFVTAPSARTASRGTGTRSRPESALTMQPRCVQISRDGVDALGVAEQRDRAGPAGRTARPRPATRAASRGTSSTATAAPPPWAAAACRRVANSSAAAAAHSDAGRESRGAAPARGRAARHRRPGWSSCVLQWSCNVTRSIVIASTGQRIAHSAQRMQRSSSLRMAEFFSRSASPARRRRRSRRPDSSLASRHSVERTSFRHCVGQTSAQPPHSTQRVAVEDRRDAAVQAARRLAHRLLRGSRLDHAVGMLQPLSGSRVGTGDARIAS